MSKQNFFELRLTRSSNDSAAMPGIFLLSLQYLLFTPALAQPMMAGKSDTVVVNAGYARCQMPSTERADTMLRSFREPAAKMVGQWDRFGLVGEESTFRGPAPSAYRMSTRETGQAARGPVNPAVISRRGDKRFGSPFSEGPAPQLSNLGRSPFI